MKEQNEIDFNEIVIYKNRKIGNASSPFGDHSLNTKEAKPQRYKEKKDEVTKSSLSRNSHVSEPVEGCTYFIFEEDTNEVTKVTFISGKLVDKDGKKYNFPDFIAKYEDLAISYKEASFM